MQEVEGIILRTYKLGETDKICVVLTRSIGKIRGVMRRSRRQLWHNTGYEEPFSEVRLQVSGREGQTLVQVKALELIASAFARASQPKVLTFLSYAAELFDGFVPEGEPSEVHYRLAKAVNAAAQSSTIQDLRIYLELWLLRLAGLLPKLSLCSKCSRQSLSAEAWLAADGSPLCYACSGNYGDYLGGESRQAWERIQLCAPAELAPLGAAVRRNLRPITSRLIRRALEREPQSLRAFALFANEADESEAENVVGRDG